MTLGHRTLQKRLCIAAALLLVAGLGSAVAIWLTAAEPAESDLVEAYLQSKVYRHELEAYGGKASVVADELARWFDSLWHGRTLGFTVAVLTVLASGGLVFAARHLPANSASEAPEEGDRGDG